MIPLSDLFHFKPFERKIF